MPNNIYNEPYYVGHVPGEEWRKVVGFPNYTVSNYGRIFSRHTRRQLGQHMNKKSGLLQVSFMSGGVQKAFVVHQVVAKAWLDDYVPGCQVKHRNGNTTDNRVENLEMIFDHGVRVGYEF